VLDVTDGFISFDTSNKGYFLGRSVVVHSSNGTRIACAKYLATSEKGANSVVLRCQPRQIRILRIHLLWYLVLRYLVRSRRAQVALERLRQPSLLPWVVYNRALVINKTWLLCLDWLYWHLEWVWYYINSYDFCDDDLLLFMTFRCIKQPLIQIITSIPPHRTESLINTNLKKQSFNFHIVHRW
jgi:hypothetical protein